MLSGLSKQGIQDPCSNRLKFLPVADNCEVEFDFFPIPVLLFGERSWSTAPLLRSVAVSDKLPSELYTIFI